jgi:hypothetical protein
MQRMNQEPKRNPPPSFVSCPVPKKAQS